MYSVLGTITQSLHKIAGDTHHTASPMGLWLLLATTSNAIPKHGKERIKVENALGMPLEQALSALGELLGQDYPFTSTSPYKVAQQFAAKEITHESMMYQLKNWPYLPIDNSEILAMEWKMSIVNPPGTFDEVVEAADDGLISSSDYSEIVDYDPIQEKMKSNVGQLQSSMALWSRGNSEGEIKQWLKKMGIIQDGNSNIKSEGIDSFYAWRNTLPGATVGDIPSQRNLNNWVSEVSRNNITEVSLDTEDNTFLVMLSAVATRLKWMHPLQLRANENLAHDFRGAINMMVSNPSHEVFITDTQFGEMGVHRAKSIDGISVYSVIADPEVNYLDVITTAHEIAAKFDGSNLKKPLHSLEVGGSTMYDILKSNNNDVPTTAYLPRWKTSNVHKDLEADDTLGFTDVTHAILDTVGVDHNMAGVLCQQDIVADYTATGFCDRHENSEMDENLSDSHLLIEEKDDFELKLSLSFDRPYAVVVVVDDGSMWTGTPLSSSWVKEAL